MPQAGSAKSSPKSSFFPETNDKVVGYWLLGSAVSVFGIVIFGGLTRLTESGYVDLITGIHTRTN
jgi:cytochrome c oxidase assembly protein subunit 15